MTALAASTLAFLSVFQVTQDPGAARYEQLSDRERAGQLFMSWIAVGGEDAAREEMLRWVREVPLGGVILSVGTVEQAADLVPALQDAAAVPLLMAADFEAGVAYRFEGATHPGNNMLLGAAGLERLARAAGRVTATEARALGVHWTFAPVLDVNDNPRNPIINVRSFGEDPRHVARLGAALIGGLREGGQLATAKHFPGHGNVARDSHLELPTVPGDRARLEANELLPFRRAVRAGVEAVMVGHLQVPGLDPTPDLPATLSRPILTELLREDMGFAGLVVTDALDMGGVRGALPPGEVAVRALLAGADVLLMPPDPLAARDAVLKAVEEGRLPRARFRDAVQRVLAAKERLGLFDWQGRLSPRWNKVLAEPSHRAVADEVAERGLTLVRDRWGQVPLPHLERTVLISVSDEENPTVGKALASALGIPPERHRQLFPSSGEDESYAAAMDFDYDAVIVSFHVRVRSGATGTPTLPGSAGPIVESLRVLPRAVVVSFGSPYLEASIPEIVGNYLCAYCDNDSTAQAVARVLRGEASVTGRLPVGLRAGLPAGSGVSRYAGRGVPRAEPAEEGVAPELSTRVWARLLRAVDEKVTPGAVVAVARRGRLVVHEAVGRETYAATDPEVTTDSVYDLASLTKVLATAPVALHLVQEKVLDLDEPILRHLPAFTGGQKSRVTLRHLLTHSSGLPPHRPFYRDLEGKDAIVAATLATELAYEPGTESRYSDLGLITTMALIEAVTGESFDAVVQREVFEPLDMKSMTFAPQSAVPTEEDPWRGRLVRAEVHDENAFAMGGMSGHAGLFGTAADVVRLGCAYLGGGRGWLEPLWVDEATRRGKVPDSTRALGWDTFEPGGSGGTLLSERAFGHTGFTGTSIWCDPRWDLCIVLLTNRVHPSREGRGIQTLRGDIADMVVEALEDRR